MWLGRRALGGRLGGTLHRAVGQVLAFIIRRKLRAITGVRQCAPDGGGLRLLKFSAAPYHPAFASVGAAMPGRQQRAVGAVHRRPDKWRLQVDRTRFNTASRVFTAEPLHPVGDWQIVFATQLDQIRPRIKRHCSLSFARVWFPARAGTPG